jgi:pimeloyl-ACP methyl ester carboxylesterase
MVTVPDVGVLGALCLIALLLIGWTYRRIRQRTIANTLALRTPRSIDEGLFVRIGGIEQWFQIRGQNRDNPILLFLHGGPGVSYVPFAPTFRSWEAAFTIVQWDQRGAGKTYGRNGDRQSGSMTIARMVQDGIEAAEFVGRRLNKQKMILFAHSLRGLTVFDVPIFLFQGDTDLHTPAAPVQEYFASVRAPNKHLKLLKGEGHTAVLSAPELFLADLVAYVRPLASSPKTQAHNHANSGVP